VNTHRTCRFVPADQEKVMQRMTCFLTVVTLMFATAVTASAGSFFFSTGAPDGRIATASRPESHRKIEIESADDFILASHTVLTEATFTGLLNQGGPGEIREVRVEIYRVFPADSNTARTIHVPTRANSPSDVALTDRSNIDGTLRSPPGRHRAVANSVINGIHPCRATREMVR
jgi:hypothetical protein